MGLELLALKTTNLVVWLWTVHTAFNEDIGDAQEQLQQQLDSLKLDKP